MGSGSAAGSSGAGAEAGASGSGGMPIEPPPPGGAESVVVRLIPNTGVSGTERINFAVPLRPGQLADEGLVTVVHDGVELATARRALARYSDGSLRSVQLQVDLAISGETTLDVTIGQAPSAASLSIAAVDTTLVTADGTSGPRVWALLPAEWLSDSGVAGPQVPEAQVSATPLDAWRSLCDYTAFDADAFIGLQSDPAVWLYDRGTTLYRGYARRGDLVTLSSGYRETSIYRNGITGTGSATRIGVPGKDTDLKYHYAQNLAIHYLLTGDDRFRESAEAVADRVSGLWPDPGYAGGTDFWTERNAGFGLLAYVWAMVVSDDRAGDMRLLADAAVDAYIAVQETYPAGYTDATSRCFSHSADAHGEPYGYFGCSPWMSAILADALDAYAAESTAQRSAQARTAIVKLGRLLAREGRDTSGRPFYWMGVGVANDEIDDYDEHWGESAYIIAMAWHHGGRTEGALRTAADELVQGFGANGVAPHMRSFNWQCRSAVATAWYLE